jgi:hypothetical protein
MPEHAVDTVSRTIASDRRRAVLALGAAGLATTLAGSLEASAKQSAGKKRCKKQKQACVNQVTTFCAKFGADAPQCQSDVFPCCETCDLATGVICALNAIAAA